MRPVWTFSVFSLQSYSCFRERSFFLRWGGGEGEQTADQVSVNFINLWSSHTTGLLEPPRWKSEPPHWKCGLASEKGLPDPQKMKIRSQKKSLSPNPSEHELFAKKRIKIGKIWPLQLHFWSTDAYRGSPPYAIFPLPDTKKYSIVLC